MLSHTIDGTAVRRLRELRGKSVAQLADAVGFTPDYLYKIEQGRKQPGAGTAKRLADELEIKVEELLTAPSTDPAADPDNSASHSGEAGAEPTVAIAVAAVAAPEPA